MLAVRAAVTCQEASEQLVRQWLQGANEQLAPQCQGEWCWGLRLPDWQGQAEQEQTACLPAVTSAHWSACQWEAKHTMCSCHALQSIGLQKAYCRQLALMAGDWHYQLTAKAEADKHGRRRLNEPYRKGKPANRCKSIPGMQSETTGERLTLEVAHLLS